MNAAAKNSPRTGSLPASLAYAEAFVAESEPSRVARRKASGLGLASISGGVAAALTLLTKTLSAKAVVEIGTGTGVSGLALFAGMVADGVLTSIDSESENQAAAREAFSEAAVPSRRIRLIAGQALNVLPKLSDGAYDVVFVNGDPLEYVEYVAQAERLLRPGGLLLLHHALWEGKVADEQNSDDEPLIVREALEAVQDSGLFTAALLPVGDGLLVAVRD
ncbi:putative O-methyltransferase YrrM [Propionicimonas paludicola]|uniref:Putative O-methyltransferase YrrM n=1 Tax=Propionicimonas paludicola TaxID=185243 RepID=A0A2A9CUP8_9ACTN|nr:class I SAM-dependent methyltransferase [Propionicimonas paludicola]PFG17299.1 putative O-methyltransferase YrrM [Propionicimonas paludicola]